MMRNKAATLIAIAIAVSACAPHHGDWRAVAKSKMGNQIKAEYQKDSVDLHVHFVKQKQLDNFYKTTVGGTPIKKWAAGLSMGSAKSNRCDIYVLRPRSPIDMRLLTMGHEVSHCIFGAYHQATFHHNKQLTSEELTKDRAVIEAYFFSSSVSDIKKQGD